tara:strand:+ start:36 stop:464 length:429 start_codon:yes stop_codon:yes gene_type:complete
MNDIHTGDLELGFQAGMSGYSLMRTEDMFDPESKLTSGINLKMGPDLATRELDLESILQIEPRVKVRYTWDYSRYIVGVGTDEELDNNLPYDWTTESDTGTIDRDDDSTWPRTGHIEWYEDGQLSKVWSWKYGEKEWDEIEV